MSDQTYSGGREIAVGLDSNGPTSAGISVTTTPKKVVGRPFVKGQSGNPAGHPKALSDLTALARSYCPKSTDILFGIISNERAAAAARVAGIALMYERAYGKAVQPVDINLQADLAVLLEAGRRRVLGE